MKNTKRKILSIILAIAMLACMIPLGTLAAAADSITSWSDLHNAINAAPGDGTTPATETTTIQLTQDLTAPDGAINITIPKGKDITLDLNGKVLNANGKCRVIRINEGGKLTVIDSLPATEHKGYMDANGLWQLGEPQNSETAKNLLGGVITGGNGTNGGGIYNNGTVNMYGGNIAGNTVRSDTYTPLGGGVYNSGTFTMYGGNITGNAVISNSKVVFGGGVYNSGTFTMKNGHIDGNTAHSDTGNECGGGVYNTGTFMMENGSISNNTASSISKQAMGGGVYISQGTFTMEDGSISGNTVQSESGKVSGGGVYMYAGTFTMKKGAIDENTAHSTNANTQGGGVSLDTKSCVFLMEDGSISGNTASSTTRDAIGGGVYVGNGTFTMKKGTIDRNTVHAVSSGVNGGGVNVGADGKFIMEDGSITGNTAISDSNTAYAGGVYNRGTFTMKNGEISGNTADYGGGINALATAKVYLTADTEKTVSITGNKANKAVGGVNSLGETHLSGKVSVKDNICTNTYGSQNYPVNLAVAAPIIIDDALTDSEIYVTLADSSDNTHKAGVLTSGYATYGADVFTYEGPYEMITNADGELEVVETATDIIKIESTPTPYGQPADYLLTVTGRAIKLQFVDENGNTWTFSRDGADLQKYAKTVIASYDKDGNPVNDDARALDHEVWNVTALLPEGNYKVIAKYAVTGWHKDTAFDYTVVNKIDESAYISYDCAESGPAGRVTVKVTTESNVQKVQLAMNGTTNTSANFVVNPDGTKTFTLTAFTVKGENNISINIKSNNKWYNNVDVLTYTAE